MAEVRAKLEAKRAELKAQSEAKKMYLEVEKAHLEVEKALLEAEKILVKAKKAKSEAEEMKRRAKEAEFEAEKIARDTAKRTVPVLNEHILFGYCYITSNMIITNYGLAAENTDREVSFGGGYGYVGPVHGAVFGARPLKGKAEFEIKIVSQNNCCISLVLQWCEKGYSCR